MKRCLLSFLCVAIALAGCRQATREAQARADIASLAEEMSKWSSDIKRLESEMQAIQMESAGITNEAVRKDIFRRHEIKREELDRVRQQHDAAEMKRLSLMIELNPKERGPSNRVAAD